MENYNNKNFKEMMKIAALLTLATVAFAKHHHHHTPQSEVVVADVDDYDWDNEISVSQKAWNVAGTLALVKQFEGCRLTAY